MNSNELQNSDNADSKISASNISERETDSATLAAVVTEETNGETFGETFVPNYDCNIVLIGMPGVGKSTIGVVLAKILNYDFLDGDIAIQKEMNATLSDLIKSEGVEGFIEIEGKVLSSLGVHHTVIATGGSAIYSDNAMKVLGESGIIVYLQSNCECIKSRLGDLVERGVVMKEGIGNNIDLLYKERMPLYEAYADITVNVSNLELMESITAVLDRIKERKQ